MVLKYTFLSQSLVYTRDVDFTISVYKKNVVSSFFIKFSFQNQFAGGFK